MQVLQEVWVNDILSVAELANKCMKRNVRKRVKRPSMEEVVADLDKLVLARPKLPNKCVIDNCISLKCESSQKSVL